MDSDYRLRFTCDAKNADYLIQISLDNIRCLGASIQPMNLRANQGPFDEVRVVKEQDADDDVVRDRLEEAVVERLSVCHPDWKHSKLAD